MRNLKFVNAAIPMFLFWGVMSIGESAGAVSFPRCVAQDGQEVTVHSTQSTEGGPAFSTILNGKPIIVFNEKLMAEYAHTNAAFLFIFMHECGHQALGHTTEHSKSKKHTNEEELAADCYAAQHLRSMGAKPEDMNAVVEDLKLLRKDPDHPGHTKRIANALACFGK